MLDLVLQIKLKSNHLNTFLVLASIYIGIGQIEPAQAEIIPDNTLGNENSVVTPQENRTDLIEDGTIRDRNLFHSFSDFNVNDGSAVYFASPDGINNILTRVTGNNVSNIFGTLGVNGNANLFLLNPNGIIFGQNSALDISGSFLATTAESYIFNDDFVYSASNPEIPPLLTIDIPVGVQFGTKAETITNLSQVVDPTTNSIVGLQVPQNESLVLLGGDIIFDGGNLITAGKVELGSVMPRTEVNFELDRSVIIDYKVTTKFQDIYLRNLAKVEAEDDIQVMGREIILTEGSQIRSNTTDINQENLLTINASEKLAILGVGQNNTSSSLQKINSQSAPANKEDAINIKTPELILNNGAEIIALVMGEGDGGDIKIDAQKIEVSGISEFFTPTLIGLRSQGQGKAGNLMIFTQSLLLDTGLVSSIPITEGDGGNVEIEADTISIINGGQIQSGALFGSGNGGNLNIKAKTINISGVTPFNISPETNLPNLEGEGGKALSGLFASVNARSTGNAGDIFVQTDNLKISDGGTLGSNTNSKGNAGDIHIKAKDVEVRDAFVAFNGTLSGIRTTVESGAVGTGGDIVIDSENLRVLAGGQIDATTLGEGDAGNITLDVENLQVAGISETQDLVSTITAVSENNFAAGSIDINASNVYLSDRANVSVSNIGQGNSGNLNITTSRLDLDNSATIEAKVNTGSQGNINLTTDNVFLNNQSEITVLATGAATGGNISLNNTENLVLLNNSQIVADAIEGNGGNIEIKTQGYFVSADSLVSASSEFGLDGGVEVENMNRDRQIALGRLPQNTIQSNQQITQGCNVQSDFVIPGRGGLPSNPTQNLKGQAIWQDTRIPIVDRANNLIKPFSSAIDSIIEAGSWQINQAGKIELVATSDPASHVYFADRQCTSQ